jgi:hypothetical protein
MRECMHRVVDAKALPGFGAGRGEGLSRGRPEVNGLVNLSDAPSSPCTGRPCAGAAAGRLRTQTAPAASASAIKG